MNSGTDRRIEAAYALAKDSYAELGVDVDAAIDQVLRLSVSLHCWQGDDLTGFERSGARLGGGLSVSGSYPGKARTPDELRCDLETALSLIPGRHRVNLHASYLETPHHVERNELRIEHFQTWVDWAKARSLGLDFNPTFFAHRNAEDGFTLAHRDTSVRQFWIEHGIASRRIAAGIGAQLGSPCITNFWIPDGYKDDPIDRLTPRQRLAESLDVIFAERFDLRHQLDALESKLFGLGSESYVVGSHEFYLGYAITRQKLLCLDTGHFHPTESIPDKVSSVLLNVPAILLHISRGVRWDSDHVVVLSDELLALAQQLVRGKFLSRTHLALDYFDATINRVAAWVIGTRNLLKALLCALLEPTDRLLQLEQEGNFTARLTLLEELKTMPLGAVWDAACARANVPVGPAWMREIEQYEHSVLSRRV